MTSDRDLQVQPVAGISHISAVATVTRAKYESPTLVSLGDVRDLTLGGSPGSGDSGNTGAQQF